MTSQSNNHLVSVDAAAEIASRHLGLQISATDFDRLIGLGIVPSLGSKDEPRIFVEHARTFGAIVGTVLDIDGQRDASTLPPNLDVLGQVLLRLSPNIAISFHPASVPVLALQLFIRALRSLIPCRQALLFTPPPLVLTGGLCVWCENSDVIDLESLWARASSEEFYIHTSEGMCVPSLYGNKIRLAPFILGAMLQTADNNSLVCDLMAGTGIVSRRLLAHFPVLANDASPFSAVLAKSQVADIDDRTANRLRDEIAQHFDSHFAALCDLLAPALQIEEQFLVGGLSPGSLDAYRAFTSSVTRFVPGSFSEAACDKELRPLGIRLTTMVEERRQDPALEPYVLATAYWSNCYFGVRQAAELDSLTYAVNRVSALELPLLQALLLSAAEACMSGPHFAQPPKMATDLATRKIIEKRARSVLGEFNLRLMFAAKRPKTKPKSYQVTCLPWREALVQFDKFAGMSSSRVIYADPPYSRLQYSRYYHVFDTLLRYDYPECEGSGRTSERAKRFSSLFDSREGSARKEFDDLFRRTKEMNATLCVSYSTEGTVAINALLDLATRYFGNVAIYTAPIRHHSQGRVLENRGHRVEILLVCRA